jgi:hypothetical protein
MRTATVTAIATPMAFQGTFPPPSRVSKRKTGSRRCFGCLGKRAVCVLASCRDRADAREGLGHHARRIDASEHMAGLLLDEDPCRGGTTWFGPRTACPGLTARTWPVTILLAAAVISTLTGDLTSFIMIPTIVLMSAVLDTVQEFRAEEAAESLKVSVALKEQVLRDGQEVDGSGAGSRPRRCRAARRGGSGPGGWAPPSHFQAGMRNPLDTAIVESGPPRDAGWAKIDGVPFDFQRRRVSVLVEHEGRRLLITPRARPKM